MIRFLYGVCRVVVRFRGARDIRRLAIAFNGNGVLAVTLNVNRAVGSFYRDGFAVGIGYRSFTLEICKGAVARNDPC